ncbi:MAG: glycosyltransferase [Flavobacteriales bacterium]|nr:glycosyltransferase [Flavobacteriales bacterium]
MKKVLIITYYWPPSGGAGVQRWLKFAKYLPEFGWKPIIYTPENPEFPVIDESLMKDVPEAVEVLKQPIWEPYNWYRQFLGQKDKKIGAGFVSEKKEPGLLHKISVWVRGNFFIPDARKFWIRPSVRFLTEYLRENPVDAVVSTGPPHSMHLIALELKKQLGVKWIADFRDPWTNIDFYEELMLTKWADRKHRQLEREVLTKADKVVTIGYTMTEEMRALGASSVETITNGFDEEDFPETEVPLDKEFSISHIGTFSPARNHPKLWQALAELKAENAEFAKALKIRTVGVVDHSVAASIEEAGLAANWERIDYVSHDKVLEYQRSSRVLLVSINNTPNATGILPGKFFEYLASGRPILAIGPKKSDIGTVLSKTNAGMIVERDDIEGMKRAIRLLFEGDASLIGDKSEIAQFSRKGLTERLIRTIESLK